MTVALIYPVESQESPVVSNAELRARLVARMRAGGHTSYEQVAEDILPEVHAFAADELRTLCRTKLASPSFKGIRHWLTEHANRLEVR